MQLKKTMYAVITDDKVVCVGTERKMIQQQILLSRVCDCKVKKIKLVFDVDPNTAEIEVVE